MGSYEVTTPLDERFKDGLYQAFHMDKAKIAWISRGQDVDKPLITKRRYQQLDTLDTKRRI